MTENEYQEPSEVKISTMTLVSNIKSDNEEQSIEEDNIKTDISLDILCRFINRYSENDEILTTSDGGITSIDYYTNFSTSITYENLIKHKNNPFFNQMSVILETFGFKKANVKIFNNAKLQMTGVLSENEGENVSKKIINILKTSKIKIYTNTSFLDSMEDKSQKLNKTNDYALVYNHKTDKMFYYRWNYLDIIGEIEKHIKVPLFNKKKEEEEFKKKLGWISDTVIMKFIYLLQSRLTLLNQIKDKINKEYTELSEKKDNIKMNAMNTNCNIDEEEAKINTMLFELNSNKSIITENIIDLSNIYNKIKLIRETDILVLKMIKKKYNEDLQQLSEMDNINECYEYNIVDNIDTFKLNNTKIELINSDFSTNFLINNTKLYKIVKNKYKAFSSYEPNDYPGVKNKFFWNVENVEQNRPQGKCQCEPKCIKRGKKSLCTQITISVFQSGSVIITGAKSIQQVRDAYTYINKIFKDNFDDIKGKITEEDKAKNQEKINNNRKIMRKKRLFYFKVEDVYSKVIEC